MKKKLMTCLIVFLSINCFAQENQQIHPYSTILSNGATATFLYEKSENVLKVTITNNENEVEVIAVKDGVVTNSETTNFTNDEIQLNLSKQDNGEYEIYVKTGNEIQLVGTVEPSTKPEEE